MARRTNHLPEELYAYLLQVSVREPPIMTRLRDETASLEQARMQIGPAQGQFMALLVQLMGARSALEVGTDHAPALETIPTQAARLGFRTDIEETGASEWRIMITRTQVEEEA